MSFRTPEEQEELALKGGADPAPSIHTPPATPNYRPATDEAAVDRIKNILERTAGRQLCKHCGFTRFSGGIHPYAGNAYPSKSETKWCLGNGKFIHPVEPEKHYFRCNRCKTEFDLDHLTLQVWQERGLCCICDTEPAA